MRAEKICYKCKVRHGVELWFVEKIKSKWSIKTNGQIPWKNRISKKNWNKLTFWAKSKYFKVVLMDQQSVFQFTLEKPNFGFTE